MSLTRRQALRGAARLGAGALACSLVRAAPASSDPPYNVVVVVLDDVHPSAWRRMAWLTSRAAVGGRNWVRFTRGHLDTPICGPSRVSFLSGMQEQRHRVSDNGPATIEAWHEAAGWKDRTIGAAFQAAGYTTAFIGKYLNEYPWSLGASGATEAYVPPHWDDWMCLVDNIGSRPLAEQRERYDGVWYNRDGTLVKPAGGDGWYSGAAIGATPSARAARTGATSYVTDLLNRRARKLVAAHAGEPFLLCIGHVAPHTASDHGTAHFGSAWPSARHRSGSWSGGGVGKDPAFGEPDVSDKPAWLRGTAPSTATFDSYWRSELPLAQRLGWQAVQAADEQLYDLELALDATGVLDRTVIVVYADNGYLLGEHRQEGKVRPYEPSIHTDVFIRHPEVGASWTDASTLVSHLDVTATILDVAGATPLAPQDGQSLLPLLRGETTPAAFRPDLHASVRAAAAKACPGYHLLTTFDGWKYVAYDAWTKSSVTYPAEDELYDLNADPSELVNLARSTSPHVQARRAAMADRLAAVRLD